MKIAAHALLASIALGALVVGCAQKRTQPVAQSAAPPAITQLPPPVDEQSSAPGEVKEKKPRFGESVVYVDGKPVGVIRATELPLALKGRVINVGGGYQTTHYGFVDYVRALGVDSKRIKALHLYGGSRVVVLDKAEVARIGDRVSFSFVQGDRGKPRVHWPAVKLHVNTTIDMVSNVAVYVDKEPPVLKDGELWMPNGTRVETKVPYAPEEQGNGTRIYVDGALVGVVKRKKITNDMLSTSTAADTSAAKTIAPSVNAEDRFSLLSYAAKLRGDAKQVKSIDLVAGDDVIAHLASDGARALTFNVPAHNRGQAVVDVPSADTAATQRSRVSAVQIYINSTPPTRPVVKVDEAPEAGIGSGQGGSGSGSDEEL